MAGGTHVFDMIKRLKENRNLRTFKYFKKGQPKAEFYPTHEQKASKLIQTISIMFRLVVFIGVISLLVFVLSKLFS